MPEPSESDARTNNCTFIVASALEGTWPVNNPIVFLGEWCLRYSRREVWSALDYSVVAYHWDNRARIPKDLEHISDVYEALLAELAVALNAIHGVRHSVRYWRIVVGWWLFYFTQIFFDRWQVVHAGVAEHPNARMLRMPATPSIPASRDMTEFVEDSTGDHWNERLCADIAERWTTIQVSVSGEIAARMSEPKQEMTTPPPKTATRSQILTAAQRAIGWVGRRPLFYGAGVALHASYLRRLERAKFAFLLGQVPSMETAGPLPYSPVNPAFRTWALQVSCSDAFVGALAELVPEYLPSCYLEGYAEASSLATNSSLSTRAPRVIMTANSFSGDERWKYWAATQVEQGVKLVIAQHGGHYGTGAWSATQQHDLAICDRYLSWGWSDGSQPKVHPAPATKLIGLKKRHPIRHGKCLQVTASCPRQSYWMYSVPTGPQFHQYIEDQLNFARALTDEVKANLVVRLYPRDYGWDIDKRWEDEEPTVKIDSGQRPIHDLLADTRIYVATYNATTFLESMAQDIPTVMFWNPKMWELSEGALDYFQELRQASILFDEPAACAAHVNSIWEDVPAWWSSSTVRTAVRLFSRQFAYTGHNPLRELKAALTDW
jgi:putative transferase (TIGR04331 family)